MSRLLRKFYVSRHLLVRRCELVAIQISGICEVSRPLLVRFRPRSQLLLMEIQAFVRANNLCSNQIVTCAVESRRMLQEVCSALRIDSACVTRAISTSMSLSASMALRLELQIQFLLLLVLKSAGLSCCWQDVRLRENENSSD